MGFHDFGRAIASTTASVISAAAMALALNAAAAGAAQAASALQVVLETGTGAAALVGFDPATGGVLGGFELTNGAVGVPFGRVGAMVYAPGGTLQAILETGTGTAALVGFNPLTGGILGGFELNNNGVGVAFDRIGAALYAPNGDFQVILETGANTAALVAFNPMNGGVLGGVGLANNGIGVAFDRVGAALYAPNGDFQVILETGADAAALVGFNTTSGEVLGGVGLANNGTSVAFDRVGAALYAPNGEFQVILETGADAAALVGFNTTSGEVLGGAGLTNNGVAVRFDRVGAALYAPPGEVPSGVPEPATWAMMIVGFGLAGAMTRRRRVSAGRWAEARIPGGTRG